MFNNILRSIKKILYTPILLVKAKHISNEIHNIISDTKGHNILDFGCGDTVLTQEIKKRFLYSKITPIDVVDTSLTSIKPELYNGKRIPYP
ncbi:hypothetical protein ACFLZ4_02495, partial [Patescibacteria group bacterium]